MGWLADNSTFHSNSNIPESADLVMAVLYSIFGACSLVGNAMLLYVSYKKRQLLKPAEFFIVNLAVSDLGMTLSLHPMAVTSCIYHRWLFGRTLCLIYAFCGVLFGICSLSTLTLLSTVCCLKVCYPLYGNRFGPDHCRFLIACAWAYALVFAGSPLAHWGAYGAEPYGTACCIDWRRSSVEATARSYTVALFLCCYILPCAVITSSYMQILVTVRHSRRAVEQHISAKTRMGNIQTVIVKLSVAVCIGFFAAWSPYAVVAMWAAFGQVDAIPPIAFAVPAMFAKTSTLYNPLVYLLFKPNFRHLLCNDLLSLRKACRRRLSYRFVRAVSLRSIRPRAGSAPAALGPAHCACEHCQDAFECFRHYPRRCHDGVNTVQLSLQHSSLHPPAPPAPVPRPAPPLGTAGSALSRAGPALSRAGTVPSRKSACVVIRGRKRAEIDGLEITLETLPACPKAAAP